MNASIIQKAMTASSLNDISCSAPAEEFKPGTAPGPSFFSIAAPSCFGLTLAT
ncbi:hypothetical protein [Desulfoluna butyratoxydans]|uniref:hypothetical protein n=1 Tax=Desulfoluna butyratoxydans TaxID=231438 RepID=UPI001C553068|nr:hypothetical protein [Desulfoluna butyratoxydans]